jgi:hypothetical protein
MAADRVAGGGNLLGDFGVPHRVLADLDERGLEAIVGERLEHGRRVLRPGAVVEGQHNFLIAQEIVLLEMLEAEARSAGRVDLDDARQAHAARLVAQGDIVGRAGGAGRGRRPWRRAGGILGNALGRGRRGYRGHRRDGRGCSGGRGCHGSDANRGSRSRCGCGSILALIQRCSGWSSDG